MVNRADFNGMTKAEQAKLIRVASLRRLGRRSLDLSGLDLRGANLRDANLSGADLSGANLRGVSLEGSQFVGANCSKADFERANLEAANFTSADISSANFEGTPLDGARFTDAKVDGVRGLRAASATVAKSESESVRVVGVVIDGEIRIFHRNTIMPPATIATAYNHPGTPAVTPFKKAFRDAANFVASCLQD